MRSSFVNANMFDQRQALVAVRTVSFGFTSSANLTFDHNFNYTPKAQVFMYEPSNGFVGQYRFLGWSGSSVDTLLPSYQLSFYATPTRLVLTVRTYRGDLIAFNSVKLLLIIYKEACSS